MIDQKVEAFLQRKQVDMKGKKILVGVSGGPDSIALLYFLYIRQEKWNIKVFAAHIDHMFRGEESERDALFVKGFCRERNIPFEMKQINVPEYMEREKLSAEIAARECRYAFYREVMEKHNISILALGHHGDDQIETILMRLTRGSSGHARGGIPFQRPFHHGIIIRPFLVLNREEIEAYCDEHKLNPRIDSTNEQELYTRNRFRKHVLPFLKSENRKVHEHFQRFSEEVIEDENYLQHLTREKIKEAVKEKTEEKVTVQIDKFLSLPIPLQRRGIQLILNYLYKMKPPLSLSAIHVENILTLMKNPHPSGTLHFPNELQVIRSYGNCYFITKPNTRNEGYHFLLRKDEEVILPNKDRIVMEFVDEDREIIEKDHTFVAFIDEQKFPLIIRTRKDGDRISLKGLDGRKKVKKVFIENKVPLHKRNSWPIITDNEDQIIWIPQLCKSNLYKKRTSKLEKKVLLTYNKCE